MGREFIGECEPAEDAKAESYQMELAIKFIKKECGEPPRGVDVQVCRQDHELGSYPVIAVVWDDYEAEYPDEYIGKCIEAFERFETPEDVLQDLRERAQIFREAQDAIQKAYFPDSVDAEDSDEESTDPS